MAIGGSLHSWSYLAGVMTASATALYDFVALFSWAVRQWWTGRLIVNASRPRSRWRVSFYVGYTALWVAAVLMDPGRYLLSFSSALLIATGASLLAGGVLEIRERGIFWQSRLIAWTRIKSWRWESAGRRPMAQWSGAVEPETAIIKIELSRPWFFSRSVRIQVGVPFVDSFSRALDENLTG